MRRQVIEGALLAAVLLAIVGYGVFLRLEDPLSTRALAAEDPWSHVVFTKEWQKQGFFADSFQMGTEMYPPGMHAWLAAFVPFTGISLITFARLAPAFFGGLAILGMFVVGQRLGGSLAGLMAAFLTAIMPEHIFRTELLFPTALDLALLPFWVLTFHDAIHKPSAFNIGAFALSTIPLAVMHPWAIPLLGVPLATYAALRAFRNAIPRKSLWIAGAMLVPAVVFSMTYRWNVSDTGFADFLAHVPGLAWLATTAIPLPVVFLALLAILGTAGALAIWIATVLPPLPRIAGIVVGLALVALVPWLARSPPVDVDFLAMLGPIALWLALAGFVLAVLWPSAVGDLGISVSFWLFPLTAINIFNSPFWPQRTVVYLSIGVALLGASVVAHAPALAARFAKTATARAGIATATLVALSLVFAGSAIASPPDTYSWYRLYNDNEFAGYEQVGKILDKDPSSRIFVYTWQPALIVKAVTAPEHVWYGSKFFQSESAREKQIENIHGTGYALVDKHTRRAADQGKIDLDFLKGHRLVFETPGGDLQLYEVKA